MKVSEIMTPAAVTDRADDTLAEAARKMWEQQTGSLVVTEGDELIGILTERDILRAVATGIPLESTSVSDAMAKDVITAPPFWWLAVLVPFAVALSAVASALPARTASRLSVAEVLRYE